MTAHAALSKATLRAVAPASGWLPSALVLLLATFLAAPALAATYYVTTGGSDGNPGTSSAPWRTIGKANATLGAGDVVILGAGTWSETIQPANNGSAAARISYVGNLANPAAVVVNGIQLSRSWISVKGVKATSSFAIAYGSSAAQATHDSVAWCIVPECTLWGAQDCMVARCVVNGQTSLMYDKGYATPTVDPAVSASMWDTLRENVFTCTITWKGIQVRATRHCLFENNTFNFNFDVARGSDVQGRYLYNSFSNTFRGNRWNMEANAALAGGAPYVGFSLRDSSSYNTFERDTMYCGLQSGFPIGGRLCNAGNAAWTGQCVGNVWRNCLYKTTDYTWAQDLLNGATLEGSVFASRNSWGLYFLAGVKNTTIRNCTIASWAGAAVRVEGDLRLGGNTIQSNILYSDSVAACYSGRTVLWHNYPSGFTEDYNLFYARAAAPGVTGSGQAVYWSSSACSGVGSGTGWASATGNDTHSTFSAPLFVSDRWATFDAHLRSGSPAIAMGAGGADAGAYPFVAGSDTPPLAITDLRVVQRSDNYALLAWTAPRDNSGAIAEYDLRMANAPITEGSFAAAASVAVAPAVLPAGSAQSYALTGLAPSTTYYFAIKSRDAAGNWSAISIVPGTTTTSTDQLAPARISDFTSP